MNKCISDAETTSLRCVLCLVTQSCLTLCSPMDCPPSSSVHGIFQARILEWFAISYSRGFSWLRDRTHVSCISCFGRQILYHYHQSFPLIWQPSFYLHAGKWKNLTSPRETTKDTEIGGFLWFVYDETYRWQGLCIHSVLQLHFSPLPPNAYGKIKDFQASLESP